MQGKRNSLPDLLLLEEVVCSLDNVLQEHGNGHGTNAARNWSDDGGDLGGGVELDVTHESLTGLAGRVGDVVGSNINDDSAGLQPLALDKVGGANGNDDDVCVLEVELEVGGLGVADGDRGIGSVQQLSDGATDNVASADDDGVLAGKLNTSLLEQSDDSLGGAGREDGLAAALGELADVVGAEPVDILLVSDGGRDVGLRDVLRKGQLDEDAVDRVVVVEAKDLLEQLDLGNVLGEVKQLAVDAGLEKTTC